MDYKECIYSRCLYAHLINKHLEKIVIAIFVVGWCVHKRNFFMDVSGYYDSSEERLHWQSVWLHALAVCLSVVACFRRLPKGG